MQGPDGGSSELRELRRRRGHTLEAVSILSGRDPATISRIERHEIAPTPETIVALAAALKVSARRLARMVKQP
jgi:transcriptional regulator with XRE-family HTH domain